MKDSLYVKSLLAHLRLFLPNYKLKTVCEQKFQQQRLLTIWKAFHYSWLLALSMRVMINVSARRYSFAIYHYDPILYAFQRDFNFLKVGGAGQLVLASASLFPPLAALIEWLTYTGMPMEVMTLPYELIVYNVANYHHHTLQPIPLNNFRLLSVRIRNTLAKIAIWSNLMVSGLLFIIGSIFGLLGMLYFFQYVISNSENCLNVMLTAIDLVLMVFYTWSALRSVICVVFYFGMVVAAYSFHIAELNHQLRRDIKRVEVWRGKHNMGTYQYARWRLSAGIALYRSDYSLIVRFCKRGNSALVSPLIFTALCTNLPTNTTMLAVILFWRLGLGERIMLLVCIIAQVSFTIVACLLCVWLTETLHSTSKLSVSCQGLLLGGSEPQIRTKLKLLSHYEAIHGRGAFHFTAGAFGRISRRSMYRFFFIYSAYLMYVFNMFRVKKQSV